MMFGFTPEVVHVTAHHRPCFLYGGCITVPLPDHPRDDHGSAAPLGRIAESPGRLPVFGHKIRNQPFAGLRFFHIADQFPVQLVQIKIIKHRSSHQIRLLEPAMFFAVRAIGQHALKITLYGPLNEVVCLVKKVIGALKVPGGRRRVPGMQHA